MFPFSNTGCPCLVFYYISFQFTRLMIFGQTDDYVSVLYTYLLSIKKFAVMLIVDRYFSIMYLNNG